MPPGFVTIRISRVFPYPLAETFAWLTDYQDDDPQRAGAVIERRDVVSRAGDTIQLDATLHIAGIRGKGLAEVKLDPPAHYTATIVKGSGRGSVYDYRLTPVEGGTRLDVAYNIRARRLSSRVKVLVGKPVARYQLGRMWDGFTAAMQRELG